MTRTRATTIRGRVYDDMCTKPTMEQARKDRTDQGRGIVEKELVHGRTSEEMTEARKEITRAANLTRSVTGTKQALETKSEGKGTGKSETKYCCDCGEQAHIE